MSKFKVRDKVRVWAWDRSASIEGTIVNQNDFREPDMEYAVEAGFSDYLFVGEGQLEKIKEELK